MDDTEHPADAEHTPEPPSASGETPPAVSQDAEVADGQGVDLPSATPDDLERITAYANEGPPRTWEVADYLPGGNHGHSAAKLSSSFVAPLVAAARGYRTFSGEADLDEAVAAFGIVDKRRTQSRRVLDAVLRADVLYMPWHDAKAVAQSNTSTPKAVQWRPGEFNPNDDPGVRKRKYEFMAEDKIPLAAHPSLNGEWLDEAPVVLFAEGMLKADAALSAFLLAHGLSREDLAWAGTKDPRGQSPTEVLASLMAGVPPQERVAILCLAGVYNWRDNPEWKYLSFDHRKVWIGFDADVATNPHVWKQAAELWNFLAKSQHAGQVSLLAPVAPPTSDSGSTGADGDEDDEQEDEQAKMGLDDYLATVGSWATLLTHLAHELPKSPGKAPVEGQVEVYKDGCTVRQFVAKERNPVTKVMVEGRWATIVAIGARISATVSDRRPTTAELASGVLGATTRSVGDWAVVAEADAVEIEVQFRSPTGNPETHLILAPAAVLNYVPEQWHAKGARIPDAVLVHPEWPPRGRNGEAWIRAIKAHRADETTARTRWDTMGWVPVRDGVPVFIIGDQILGEVSEDGAEEVLIGVDGDVLSHAPMFGTGADDGCTFDDPEYRQEVRTAIEAVLNVYVRAGVWRNRANAAVVLASGLRPALPRRPVAIPYYVGARGTGKTFSAQATMAFWQAQIGDHDLLLGSAKDTATAMELAVARSVIHCVDDVAPTSSKQRADAESDAMGTLIRNVFNGVARARSDAKLGSPRKHLPKALLLLTAENEPTISSVRDRIVMCDIGYGSLAETSEPTDILGRMISDSKFAFAGAPSTVTQALVKFMRWRATRPGESWASVVSQVAQDFEDARAVAKEVMSSASNTVRASRKAADLCIALAWLERMATEVGCAGWVAQLLGGSDGLISDVMGLVAENHASNIATSPGRALLRALTLSLRTGAARLVMAENPSHPPTVAGRPNTPAELGWTNTGEGTSWRPAQGSVPIGKVVVEKDGAMLVLFDTLTALSVAAEQYPALIPAGTTERASWKAMTGEGFGRADRMREKDGKLLNTCRITRSGAQHSGYPMDLLEVLRGASGLDDTDPDDREESADYEDVADLAEHLVDHASSHAPGDPDPGDGKGQ